MVALRSRARLFVLRGLWLSSTALVAASLLPSSRARAQSIIIDDARFAPQILDTLLPSPGSPPTALVTSTGSVNTAGIAVQGSGSFTWDLTNNGSLQGTSIGLLFGGDGMVTNTGTIAQIGGGSGLVNVGVTISGTGSITNSGTISGVTGIFIGGAGTVTNQLGGSVNGGILIGGTATVFQGGKAGYVVNDGIVSNQIRLNQGGTIVNNGNVFGLLGPGFLSIDHASGTVINSGGAGAVFLGAGGTVSNSGTISNVDIGNGVRIEGGNGTVSNSGLIEDDLTAVTITNSGTVNNSGTIQQIGGGSGLINNGIHIGETGSITNSGTISGVTGILIDGAGTVNNQTGGTVNGGILIGGTATVFQSGKAGYVVNDGFVTGQIHLNQGGTIVNNGNVFGLLFPGSLGIENASGTIINSGNVGTAFLGAGGTVTNSGTISNVDLPRGVFITGGNGTVGNSGLIEDDLTAVTITNSGTVTNTGTIRQTGGGSGLVNNGIHIGETGSVTNSGTISGVTGILIDGGGTVTNQLGGSVNGGIFIGGTATVFQSGKAGLVVNDGQVVGQIRLNQGGTIVNNGSAFDLLFPSFLGIDNATGTIINTGQAQAIVLTAGGTVSNSGTVTNSDIPNAVRIQGGNGTVSNSGLIDDDSTAVTITNAGTVTNSGTISGLVGIEIGGGGTVTNSGTVAGTGGVAVNFAGAAPQDDRLVLQTGSTLNGSAEAGSGTDALILQGSNSDDIGKFLNFETLRMEGVDWTLTGVGTIANGSEIVSGTLRVNGQFTTPILTVTSGTLAGSGTVVGNVLASTGNVRPGPAGTTLSISGGNLTMASASRFLVDIVNTTNSRVNELGGGAAILQGGQIGVTFTPPSGTLLNNAVYNVLHADAGVTGAFGNNVVSVGSYRFTVSYDPDDVFLTLTRLAFNDPSICATPNQCAVGGALERLGPVIPGELGTIIGNLALLDLPTQQAALGSLAGSQHGTLDLLALEGSGMFGQSVVRRLVDRRGQQSARNGDRSYNVAMAGKPDGLLAATMPGNAPDAMWGAWFRGYGASGHLDGDLNASGASYFVGGAAMGIDRQFAPGFTAGLSIGYGTTRADFQGSNSSGRIDAYDVGLYGSYQSGGFHFDAIASFAWLDNKVDRQIVVGDLVRNANASYHGQRYGLAVESGYDIALGGFIIAPTIGARYIHLRQNAFHEDGAGGLDLDGKRTSADSLKGSAGLRLGTQFGLAGIVVAPELRGRFEHEFLDNHVSTDVNFSGQAPAGAFTVTGAKLPRDSVVVGGGLAMLLSPWTTAFVDYDYKFNKDQTVHNVTAGVRFQF